MRFVNRLPSPLVGSIGRAASLQQSPGIVSQVSGGKKNCDNFYYDSRGQNARRGNDDPNIYAFYSVRAGRWSRRRPAIAATASACRFAYGARQ